MLKRQVLLLVLGITLVALNNLTAQCYDLLVSPSGDGDYTSVQAAIDAAPDDLTASFIIYVKKGVYDEKLFIEKNFITLIGEHRDSTIITTAVLRRVWRETHPSDWGAATINVASDATDLTLAHLTVRNNFADVFPDFPDNNDHTFAIRGGGHRVIIIDCNVVTTGGDTLSLWNTDGGMFYHNACFFEGYVDYVAPRGYCYIRDSEFFGHNLTASIWHDGSGGEDHKFVIRNSHFDGVQNFPLGRHHKDAAFYLLDCTFSPTMANKELYHTGSDPLQWGERVYYYNCHRDLFDWSWYADNLDEAPGSPSAEEIDAAWTFNYEWDPESLLDGLLPYAFLPSPAIGQGCNPAEPRLEWIPGHCVDKHLLYMGQNALPPFITETDTSFFEPDMLEKGQKYYWRVDEVRGQDTIAGSLWHFFTANDSPLPEKPFDPVPGDGAEYFTGSFISLDWEYQSCNTDSFRIFVGSDPGSLAFRGQVKYPGFFLQTGDDNEVYHWRVDALNSEGITEGDVWSFVLNPTPSSSENNANNDHLQIIQFFPNPVQKMANLELSSPSSGLMTLYFLDVLGRVMVRSDAYLEYAGRHLIQLEELRDLSPGLYFCKVRFGQSGLSFSFIVT